MWKVNTKIADNKMSVEISAVIEGSHGDLSWGWHDDKEKVVVLRVSDMYQKYPVSDTIIAQAQKEAQAICDERNKA